VSENIIGDGNIVFVFRKNARELVGASLEVFKGRRVADVRVYVAGENGEPRRTKKGICVRVEDLPKLREAVDALIAAEGEAA